MTRSKFSRCGLAIWNVLDNGTRNKRSKHARPCGKLSNRSNNSKPSARKRAPTRSQRWKKKAALEGAAPPKGGSFSVAVMQLAMDLIVQAGQTFRGAAKGLVAFAAFAEQQWWSAFPTPCANTIQSWLLRVGYYQLHCPLPAAADWAWLCDQTLTIGPQKVLVIVGCRLSAMPFGERNLAPTDLHVLHVAVQERSTHETILPELQAALARTGVPRVIVTDEGSELVKAVGRFRAAQGSVAHLLDLAHAGANLLKKRWTADPRWPEFLHQLTQTNQRLRQTELAYLLSPRLRDKGRFMSVGVVLRFARRVLYWLDQGLADARGAEKYGWLKDYRGEVQRWWLEQQVVQQTIAEVRHNGWEQGTLGLLEALWSQLPAESSQAALVADLRAFATKMIEQVKPAETLPGSTEPLEASFGHWKQLVEAGPSVGVSRLVLALGAVMKPVPAEEVGSALEKTPLKQVWNWVKEHVGTTMHKLRTSFNRQTKAATA